MTGSPIVCIIVSLVPSTIEAHYVYAIIVCGVERMMEGRKGERQGGSEQKRKVGWVGGERVPTLSASASRAFHL